MLPRWHGRDGLAGAGAGQRGSSYRAPQVPLWNSRVVGTDAYPAPISWGRRLFRLAVQLPILLLALVGGLAVFSSCQGQGASVPGLPVSMTVRAR